MKTVMTPLMLKPDIDIKPYCVFCRKSTRHVASYVYVEPLNTGYDRILIRFPTHRACLVFRKILRFSGLVIAVAVLGGLYFLPSYGIYPFGVEFDPPAWARWGAAAGGVAAGGFFFLKTHFKTVGIIHQYYVLNENLPEADKSWRRRSSRFKIT